MSAARPGGVAHRQLSVGVAAARHPRPRRRRARGDGPVARTGRGGKIDRVRGAAGRRACGPSASGARNRICPPRSDPRRGSQGDAGRGGRVGVVVGQAPAGGDGATGDAATTACLVEAEILGGARKLQPPGLASRPDVPYRPNATELRRGAALARRLAPECPSRSADVLPRSRLAVGDDATPAGTCPAASSTTSASS